MRSSLTGQSGFLLSIIPSAGVSMPASAPNRLPAGPYDSILAGPARTRKQSVLQTGAAYRRGADTLLGFRDFDLKVDVRGKTVANTRPVIGLQLGNRFGNNGFPWNTAVDVEGLRSSPWRQSTLINPTDEIVVNIGAGSNQYGLADPTRPVSTQYGAGLHGFDNRTRMTIHAVMANAVLSRCLGSGLEAYVAGGAGLAIVTIRRARSYQTNPFGPIEEPIDIGEDINHLNSDDDGTNLAPPVQAKSGVSFALARKVPLLTEYRFIRVDGGTLHFGATGYSGHPPTSPWTLESGASNTHPGLLDLRSRR